MPALGTYKRKKFSEKVSFKEPMLMKIYCEIIDYNPAVDKVKPEKVKVQRHQIVNYLKRRYGPRFAAKVVATLKF